MRKFIPLFILLFPGITALAQNKTPGEKIYMDEQAEYPGGLGSMMTYLKENIHVPDSAMKRGVYGKVFLKFLVSEKGIIENVEVLKGISNCRECEDESVRAVKNMPAWKPAKINGKPVKCFFNLPVSFKSS